MSQDRDTNLALFIDFDNVALGARDARQRFDVKLLVQRVLEKGKIIVKRAYADWHYYKEHMTPLHEAAIELIEIPMPKISGKNSADIKLVVDAMDLCYAKEHIDTFVIVSGDSDFSPLVSKLRENNKRVIGIGVKNSSSHLLINNCDEFIFYDDIYRHNTGQLTRKVSNVPREKQELFDFLVATAQGLLQESRGVLYSSLIKDTMTRKQPDFNERNYGFSNFGELLEEARRLGLLLVERDARAGGTWVVQGIGDGKPQEPEKSNGSRSSRRRRRGGRGRSSEGDKTATDGDAATKTDSTGAPAATETKSAPEKQPEQAGESAMARSDKKSPASKSPAKKATAKKTAPKKPVAKKPPVKKAPANKSTAKKATAKKTPARKATTKKKTTKKATAKKAVTKKAVTKKAPTTKKTTKKGTKKATKKTAK